MGPRLPYLPFGLVGFALFGALLVVVGASQDAIRDALDLDLGRSGLLVSAVMTGVGFGVLAAGPLIDRFPRRPLFAASCAVTAAALFALGPGQAHGYAVVGVLLLAAGFGGGFYETVLNAAAVQLYGERSVRMISILHSAAAVGAIVTPLGIGALIAGEESPDWTLAFRILGAAHLMLATAGATAPMGAPLAATTASDGSRARVLNAPLLFLCMAAFAYVGIETTISGLAIPYAESGLGLSADRGRAAISVFWLGLLAGRLAFAARSAGAGDARSATVMGAVAGVALALGVTLAWTAVELLFAAIGFALRGAFPLLVALGGQRSPHAPATAVSLVAGLGSTGGFAAAWLTGVVGDAAGITVGFATLALWCAAIALPAWLSERAYLREARR